MNIKNIRYERKLNTGNFENETFSVEVELQEGEDPLTVVRELRLFVNKAFLTSGRMSDFFRAEFILEDRENQTAEDIEWAEACFEDKKLS